MKKLITVVLLYETCWPRSPVIARSRHICDELPAIEDVSEGSCQELIHHTLLHVNQNCLKKRENKKKEGNGKRKNEKIIDSI